MEESNKNDKTQPLIVNSKVRTVKSWEIKIGDKTFKSNESSYGEKIKESNRNKGEILLKIFLKKVNFKY